MKPQVAEAGGFDALRAAAAGWQRLLDEVGQGSPFLTPDWFQCCVRGYGNGKRVVLLQVHVGTRLVGVAPLWVDAVRRRGIEVRRLGFIASPDSVHIDFIVDPRHRAEVLASILTYLDECHGHVWDIVDLERWPATSPNIPLVHGLWRDRGGKAQLRPSSRLPVIPLDRSWTDYLASRSQKYRKTHRNIGNRMARLGDVTVEVHTRDDTGSALHEAVELSARSWKQDSGVAIASRGDFKRFFTELTRVATARGWLQLWLVRVEGRVVAMEYDLACDGRVYALRSDFDEEFREHSPGAFLQFRILERLFAGSYREYNTGPGVNPYKLHMSDHALENRALTLFQRNLTGTCLWAVEAAMLPWARGLRDAVGSGGR